MTTFLFDIAMLAAGQVMFAPVPPTMVPRNEVERLVLTREEDASRRLESWIAARVDTPEAVDAAFLEAGFKRVRPDDVCRNFVYSRQLSVTTIRGASVIICPDKPPFVMRDDVVPGPYLPPAPGASGPVVTAPAPRP